MSPIDAFRASLDEETLRTVDSLRAVIACSHGGLSEGVKWNAPSFALGGEDRVTLGLERKGGVRVVFHRGAKSKDSAGFTFDDPTGLATWPAPDRGVAIFKDAVAVEASREALRDLCSRWLERTR